MYDEASDYQNKINLILSYRGKYTDNDILSLFQSDSLDNILKNYTYLEIYNKLLMKGVNEEEDSIAVGNTVTIDSAVLKDGTYQKLEGIILGTYKEWDDETKQTYHIVYEVLCRTATKKDGYKYEVFYEPYKNLILNRLPISTIKEVKTVMDKFNLITIDRPI